MAELVELVREYAAQPARLSELAGELDDLTRKLPADLREGADALRLDDPQWLAEVVRQTEPLLLARLQSPREAR